LNNEQVAVSRLDLTDSILMGSRFGVSKGLALEDPVSHLETKTNIHGFYTLFSNIEAK